MHRKMVGRERVELSSNPYQRFILDRWNTGRKMVGVVRLELTTSWSQTTRPTNQLDDTPKNDLCFIHIWLSPQTWSNTSKRLCIGGYAFETGSPAGIWTRILTLKGLHPIPLRRRGQRKICNTDGTRTHNDRVCYPGRSWPPPGASQKHVRKIGWELNPHSLHGFTVKLRAAWNWFIQSKMELEPRVALGLPTYQVGVLLLN